MSNKEHLRIGEDNICPTTQQPCDDECCPPGAICNLSGDQLQDGIMPDDPEEPRYGSNQWIRKNYPVQDLFWSSRRWKEDGSDFCDMSGNDPDDPELTDRQREDYDLAIRYGDDFEPYVLGPSQRLNVLRRLLEIVEKDHPEFKEENTTGWDLMMNAKLFLAELIREDQRTDDLPF